MEVRSLRNFYWKDSKKEKMVLRKRGETFDVDIEKDAHEIYAALQSLSIEVTDQNFIPERGQYFGLKPFSEQRDDGTRLKIVPGQPVTLSQSDASRLMVMGYVRPEKISAWSPRSLLGGVSGAPNTPPKKMFDDDPPAAKESWVKTYGVKGAV